MPRRRRYVGWGGWEEKEEGGRCPSNCLFAHVYVGDVTPAKIPSPLEMSLNLMAARPPPAINKSVTSQAAVQEIQFSR